jgi:hypothetical protein
VYYVQKGQLPFLKKGNLMMRVFSAYTSEIDNIGAAVADIKSQLGEIDLPREKTFAVLSCHYEFVNSGAAQAICESLPFTVCGATSSLMGTNRTDGALILTVTVVSGDEISALKTDITPPLSKDSDLGEILGKIFKKGSDTPALVNVFAPDFLLTSGDSLCEAYNKTGCKAPLFGTYAVDDSPLFCEQCFVCANGVFYTDSIVFLSIYGTIKPILGVCSIPKSKILPKPGLVTASNATEVQSIDDSPASDFLSNFGLAKQLESSGAISALSLIANAPDSDEFYSRTLLGITENGSAITGGELAVGSEIRIGLFDREGMLNAAYSTLSDILAQGNISILFICACATRSVALGSQHLDEIELVRETAKDIPFTLAYSGGEIAPLQNGNAFFRNQSFCVCAI